MLDDSVLKLAIKTRDDAQDKVERLALKQREGDQPLPTTNDGPCIQDLVIQDIEARKQLGIRRYGTVLQPFNGRNSIRDLYEELLDAAIYCRQSMEEIARLEAQVAELMRERDAFQLSVSELQAKIARDDYYGDGK